jgi:hypothetical protein
VVRAPRNIRKRSEVIVERMVLHHHDNDVIDLAEPLGRGRRYPIRAGACGEGREHREEEAVVPVVPIDAHGGFQCAHLGALETGRVCGAEFGRPHAFCRIEAGGLSRCDHMLSRGENTSLIPPAAPVRILHPASPKIARSKHLRSSNQPSGAGAQEHSRFSVGPPAWVAVCPGALDGLRRSMFPTITPRSSRRSDALILSEPLPPANQRDGVINTIPRVVGHLWDTTQS